MRKILVLLLGPVLSLILSPGALAQFVAFNDHRAGTLTHPNATTWNVYGTPAPTWGALKDIVSGSDLPVYLVITNVNAKSGNTSYWPDPGSPADVVFNGYVDWGTGSADAIQLPDPQSATAVSPRAVVGFVFTNLNVSHRYKFTGTTMRGGDQTYSNRWSLFELSGAQSFTNAHTANVLLGTSPGLTTSDIASNQCVINTGINTAGEYASWDNIVPGPDGTFAVVCSTYRGTIPGGSSAGDYAYAITGFKLEDFTGVPVSITSQPQPIMVDEGQPATLSLVCAGSPSPTYQWYRVQGGTTTISGATNRTYTLLAARPSDNGAQFFAVAQNTVSNVAYSVTSSTAVVTVNADTIPPVLLSAIAASTLTNVTLGFSEPISAATATNLDNYRMTNTTSGQTVALLRAIQSNPSSVVLTTSMMTNGAVHIVAVSGLTDTSVAANPISPSSTLSFVAQSSFTSSSLGGAIPVASFTAVANGMNVSGGGTDIGGTSDSCQFVYQTRSGDFDVRVRIASVSLTDPWAKAGLMARPTALAANSPFAASLATPGISGCTFASRQTAGGTATSIGSFPVNYPYTWLRLQRTNITTYLGYASIDGTTWDFLGSNVISMGDPVTFGYVVASRANGVTNNVEFRDFGDAVNAVSAGNITLPVEPLGPSSRQTGLVISEIMYNPGKIPGVSNSLEYIEIFNSEPVPVPLKGFRLSGSIHFEFPTDTVVQPGGFLVVAREPAFVQSYYGLTGVLGPWFGNEELALSGNVTNNNLPSSGTIRLRSRMDAVLLEVNYESKYPWPIAADGAGHSLILARPSYGQNDLRAWAASDRTGGSPGKFDPISFDPIGNIMINEFVANSHTEPAIEDYIELYNHGNAAVNLGGAWLSDSPNTNRFRIPAGTTVGPRGFLVYMRSELPFGLNTEGGRIYLVNSNANKVIDVVEYQTQSKGMAVGRYPDGAPTFRELTARTPGTNNVPILLRDIVINEIMYNPISGNRDDQYVELYNKGTNSVNLNGWKFTHGIDFTFKTNMIISAGGYVVVAKNKAQIVSIYGLPDAVVAGDFDGNLAHSGERITLTMPEELITTDKDNQPVTNIIHVVANEVTYGDAGRWGDWSDGGGSSLELTDPRSDNQQAANWADSTVTSNASWLTMSIRITNGIYAANATNGGMPSSYSPDNLHIYLLDTGECLVDDVKVFNASGANLIGDARSSFDSGTVLSNASLALLNANGNVFPSYFNTNWVAQGSYDQSTIDETGGMNGGRCLHLRAASGGDPGPNKIRSPFFSTNASGIITIQASVKWLRGWPEIIFRTHGGGYELVGDLQPPLKTGTPGAPNSQAVTNTGPAIWDVVHSPILPAPNQPVVVTARAYDPDGVTMNLLYRINPGSVFAAVSMLDDGTGGDAVAGDGLYSATIPSQPDASIVSFYIQATDSFGVTNLFPQNVFPKPGMERCFPNDSFTRECLIRWGDFNMPGSFATYHVWMTTNTVRRWLDREPRSNGSLDMTFAYNNSRVIYNGGIKSAGSPFHRDFQTSGPVPDKRVDYDMEFNADEAFLGETGAAMVVPGNTDGTSGCSDRTGLAEKMALLTAIETGVPAAHRRFVHSFVNGSQRSKVSALAGNFLEEDAARPNGQFLKTFFPDDNDNGELVKLDDWFEFDDPAVNRQNHNATFTRRSVVMSGIEMLQTNKYRFQWQRRSVVNGSLNNWSNFMGLVNAFSPTLNDFEAVKLDPVLQYADVHQWAREIAVRHAAGDYDSWGYDRGKNNFLFKPSKGRYQFLPFDVDWSMGQQGGRGPTEDIFKCGSATPLSDYNSGDLRAICMYTNPAARRIFLGAYQALIEGPFNNAFLNPVIDQWTAAFTANNIDFQAAASGTQGVAGMKSYIQQRRDYIATYLAGVTNPFSITTPSDLSISNNWVTINGYAPVSIKTIKINGIDYPITWNSVNNWSISLYVNNNVNYLQVQPYDRYDKLATNFVSTQTVTCTNPPPVLPGTIVFNEIMYNATNADGAYIEIYNRSTNFTFDISGWRLNGLGNYTFPGGSSISNGQYLILARDRAAFAVAYGSAIPVFDVFDGKLDMDGETLTLFKPALTTNDTDLIVDKVRYEANRPWPMVAPGSSIQLVDVGQDNARVANWSSGAQWRYFSYTGVPGAFVPSYQNLYLYPDANGCDIYLDDIRLVFGTNATEGANLLRNTDFETGSNTFWNIRSPASTATNSVNHSGAYSFHLYSPSGGNPLNSGFNQSITNAYIPTTNYTISYWYLSNFKGQNLYAQIGAQSLNIKFKGTNNNISAVPCSPGASNAIAATLPPFPPLWLNEVQPNNLTSRSNRFGQFTPWVEIFNSGSNEMNLTDYFLANNYSSNLTQWAFPTDTVIGAGDYKIIWLDGADSNSIPTELHANFSIPNANGSVALVRILSSETNAQSQIVDYLNYSDIGGNLSYGDYPDGQPFNRQTFFRVTPGETNDGQPGTLKINEWMAVNVSSSTNLLPGYPNPVGGTYDDWFEIYNPNNYAMNLSGYYLTDSTNNPNQFHVPEGYTIPAHGFLVVWADNNPARNTNTQPDLHVNFNLSKDGDQIAVYDPNQNLIDVVAFQSQFENLSQGRYADGGAPLYYMANSTPGSNNVWFVNTPPSLTTLPEQVVTNGRVLYVTNVATDPDPGQIVSYHLVTNFPIGIGINSANGLFTWRVPLAQAAGTYPISIWAQDNGYPRLSVTNTFLVHVVRTNNTSVNTAPVLGAIAAQSITLGQTISFTVSVTDTDQPPQILTFTLDPGAPAGASIGNLNGAFTWTPDAVGTNQITVRVTDNGLPPLSAIRSFTAAVLQSVPQPRLSLLLQTSSVEVSWPINSAGYVLQSSGSIESNPETTWTTFTGAAITNTTTISVSLPISTNQFFRLVKP